MHCPHVFMDHIVVNHSMGDVQSTVIHTAQQKASLSFYDLCFLILFYWRLTIYFLLFNLGKNNLYLHFLPGYDSARSIAFHSETMSTSCNRWVVLQGWLLRSAGELSDCQIQSHSVNSDKIAQYKSLSGKLKDKSMSVEESLTTLW